MCKLFFRFFLQQKQKKVIFAIKKPKSGISSTILFKPLSICIEITLDTLLGRFLKFVGDKLDF